VTLRIGDELRELSAGTAAPSAYAAHPLRRVPTPRADGEAVKEAFLGAIFDVDGVLVDSPHEKAWRESLRS